MNQTSLALFLAILIFSGCDKKETDDLTQQVTYEVNEDGDYPDFLTPHYYNINATDLRNDINKLVHFARLNDYNHPFENENDEIAAHSTKREFGVGIGMSDTSQHHPAIDLHPTNPTNIVMYAAHNGLIKTYRDSPKYRHYLSLTSEIKDTDNNIIGKIVTIYAHIDLDLDNSESLQLDGQYINKGEVISKNLYSGTMGGAHLHFETRIYRNSETGNEDFYYWQNSENHTTRSSGVWSYGYWTNDLGYGFMDPVNLGIGL
ncbi:MAG: hypothetical protein COA58_11595 [Bacteroidetes bacterium]|nr:MAG: hypothetical protein COA58_11595 [Bacteroidota bacterium]